MARRFEIVDGPSKWDLMLALFDRECCPSRMVTFSIRGPQMDLGKHPIFSESFEINEVSQEDGSGENWLFKGSCFSKHAHGFFSTRTRKGWLEY